MDTWKPISSAPKDGTKIIGRDSLGCVFTCQWTLAEHADEIACWYSYDNDDEVIPQHWIQMPRG